MPRPRDGVSKVDSRAFGARPDGLQDSATRCGAPAAEPSESAERGSAPLAFSPRRAGSDDAGAQQQ